VYSVNDMLVSEVYSVNDMFYGVRGCFSAGENFRVYVMLPLLPAFEGEIGTNTGTAIQAVIHWNYSSICRGGKSLLERLVLAGGLSVNCHLSLSADTL